VPQLGMRALAEDPPIVNSATYEELKESTRRLDATIDALIAHSPVLRQAAERERIERLTKRKRELLVKAIALQKMVKTPSEFKFLPAGRHLISPSGSGPVLVVVNEAAAAECEAQRIVTIASGELPYFGFNHDDGPASFYPHHFFWRDDGVFCRGNWTAAGKRAVEFGGFKFFSPTVCLDKTVGPPHPIMCLASLGANMGGLVRAGAFGEHLRVR
jgi:hypothetical protein